MKFRNDLCCILALRTITWSPSLAIFFISLLRLSAGEPFKTFRMLSDFNKFIRDWLIATLLLFFFFLYSLLPGKSRLPELNISKAEPLFLHTHLSRRVPTVQYYPPCICMQVQLQVVSQLCSTRKKLYFIYSLSSN